MYIQANIGRNMETGPMSDYIWAQFQGATKDAILDAVREVIGHAIDPGDLEVHYGQGTWDGVVEESAHVSVFFDLDTNSFPQFVSQHIRTHLHKALSALARQWHQEAIAFLVTDSTLAMSDAEPSDSHVRRSSVDTMAGE